MDVLLIIPSYGHFGFVRACVESLARYPGSSKHSVEYCLIDDASEGWATLKLDEWPVRPIKHHHFSFRGGLSRSWNEGLRIARSEHARYAICGNSDLLFSPSWLEPLIDSLDEGYALVGPLTNAPGHATWQNVRPFCTFLRKSVIDDSDESRTAISVSLRASGIGSIEAPINGFLLAATVETWWRGAFDETNVFNPKFPLEHNEVELQHRWRQRGFRSAMVPQSYVFHYRSVSRESGIDGYLATGAVRPLRREIIMG